MTATDIQRKLDRLYEQSRADFHVPLALWLRSGHTYELEHPITLPPGISIKCSHQARLTYTGLKSGPIVSLTGGYWSQLCGVQIRSRKAVDDLVGVRVDVSCIDPVIKNVSVDLIGRDNFGFDIAGEAAKLKHCRAKCDYPLLYAGRDNHRYEDLYLISTGRTCVLLEKMPHQLTFDGSQRWAGGRHAIYGLIEEPRVGQWLNVRNMRYEQTTGTDDDWAIDITFRNRCFAGLNMDGCYSDKRRPLGARLRYNATYPRVPLLNWYGSEWPGEKLVEAL